jgi:hypothetical protein
MSTSDSAPSGEPPRSGRRRHRRRTRRWLPLFPVLALVALAAACSSSSSPFPLSGDANARGAVVPAASAGPDTGSGGEAVSPAGPATDGSSGSGSGSGTGQDPISAAIAAQVYIVKTGAMTIEVNAIDPAVLSARTAMTGLGGYISGSQEANSGDRTMASVTYRFPADRWEDAIDAIRGLSTKVIDLKTSTDEVTGQVIDLGARIDNLRSTETALQAIMAKATKIQDILEVQNQLTDIQGQIEELSAQQGHLKDQAAMSTLSVTYQLPAVPIAKEAAKGWDAGAEFDRAAAQLIGFGQALATAGIWFAIVLLPVLVVVLIAGVLLGLVVRRLLPPPHPQGPPPAVVGGPDA